MKLELAGARALATATRANWRRLLSQSVISLLETVERPLVLPWAMCVKHLGFHFEKRSAMDVSCWDFPSLSCCQRALRCLLLWVALSHCTSRAKLKLIFEFDLSVFEPVAPARSALAWPEGLAPWRAALGSDAPSPGSTEIAFKCGECVVLAGAIC